MSCIDTESNLIPVCFSSPDMNTDHACEHSDVKFCVTLHQTLAGSHHGFKKSLIWISYKNRVKVYLGYTFLVQKNLYWKREF